VRPHHPRRVTAAVKLILNVIGLLIILLLDACPNTAWPATEVYSCTPFCPTSQPTQRPEPQPTLPIDFDEFCRDKRAGAFQGLASLPGGHGVAVLCAKADFLFTKSATPTRVNRWPGASGTLPP
jgi:hypothetical protein